MSYDNFDCDFEAPVVMRFKGRDVKQGASAEKSPWQAGALVGEENGGAKPHA